MAKIPFTKLKCKINTDEVPVQIGEETIAVKQYLPIQEKLELISKVIMQAHEQDENYSNPIKAGVYRDLEVIFAYTNISFTDKQKEDFIDNIAQIEQKIERYCSLGKKTSISSMHPLENKELEKFFEEMIDSCACRVKLDEEVCNQLDWVHKIRRINDGEA